MAYLEKHLGSRIAAGTVKTTVKNSKFIEVGTVGTAAFQWMNKRQMVNLWGEEKTNAKIESGAQA
eukprot:4958940-Pyramimonas_sp.AAC.1